MLLFSVPCAAANLSKAYNHAKQPNLVVILADDLGIGDVGYNSALALGGAVRTPVLDDIAAQGTKLTRFYSNALCTPSRVSLLTGRFASRTNMKNPDGETRKVRIELIRMHVLSTILVHTVVIQCRLPGFRLPSLVLLWDPVTTPGPFDLHELGTPQNSGGN